MNTEMRGSIMPKIIYGTAWKKDRTTDLVLQAIRAGFRGIDTACQPKHYRFVCRFLKSQHMRGNLRVLDWKRIMRLTTARNADRWVREDLVGKAIQTAITEGLVRRDELFVQTKFTSIDGQDTSQPLPYDPSLPPSSQVAQSITRSLPNLHLNHIDSVILHGPLRTRADTLSAYQALEQHVEKGVIGQIGVSNFYDVGSLEWLYREAKVKPMVVQNRWYAGNGWDWGVVDWCKSHGVRYQSFWTITGSPSLLSHPLLAKIAKDQGMTPEQTVYKLCQLWGITPLCGSSTLSHVNEALSVQTDFNELSAESEDVRQLLSLMRGEQ